MGNLRIPTGDPAKGKRAPREFDFEGQRETEQDLPVSVQESPVEAWVDSLASVQTTGRECSPDLTINRNLDQRITKHVPAHQNKT